jgi:hypothetical protein
MLSHWKPDETRYIPGMKLMEEALDVLIAWLEAEKSEAKGRWLMLGLALETKKKMQGGFALQFDAGTVIAAANNVAMKHHVVPVYGSHDGELTQEDAQEKVRRAIQLFLKPRKNGYHEFARQRNPGLTGFLEPESVHTTGGRGNSAVWELRFRSSTQEQLEVLAPEETTGKSEDRPKDSLQYSVTPVRPGLLGRLVFSVNGTVIIRSWRGRLILVALLSVLVISVGLWILLMFHLVSAPALTPQQLVISILSLLVVPAFAAHLLRPWVRAADDRITIAPMWLPPLGETRSIQLEIFDSGGNRHLALTTYSGECRICGAAVELDDGGSEFPQRLVGRCHDSPREHVFSFDRVTRIGKVLR